VPTRFGGAPADCLGRANEWVDLRARSPERARVAGGGHHVAVFQRLPARVADNHDHRAFLIRGVAGSNSPMRDMMTRVTAHRAESALPGKPTIQAPITPVNGSTLSPFVVLL
jgi:hypothetical protein